jgi:TRAP-type C4-dicarboxylate transport system permease small subunit
MKRLNGFIQTSEYVIGSAMIVSIVLLVFASAVFRVFRMPITWSVDLSQLFFVWISMFGADIALKKCSHMGVDIITRYFPQNIQKALAIFSCLICAAFLVFTAYWGGFLCFQNYLRKYATLKISYSFATAAVPTVSVLMLLTLAQQFFELVKTGKRSAENSADETTL